jgi:hypothetical protein
MRNSHSRTSLPALFSTLFLPVCILVWSTSARADTTWVRRYAGPSADVTTPYGPCLAVDPGTGDQGYVVVAGAGTDTAAASDFITLEYSDDGELLWSAVYDGPGHGVDTVRAIAIDSSGQVYVTGPSTGSGTGEDYATVKYDWSGTERWVTRYDGPGHGDDVARRIVVNPFGVYVTGFSRGEGTGEDFATVKYDGNGVEQWVARYDGLAHSSDRAFALGVDLDGNAYVAGYSEDDTVNGQDFTLVKYDSLGVQRWVAKYNGPASGTDEVKALALDWTGDVYVTGNSRGNDFDIATIKYTPSGDIAWLHRYDGPAQGYDKATDIVLDQRGVYVVGRSTGNGTGVDYVTLKLDATTGIPAWVERYNNAEVDSGDRAYAVAVDDLGNVYVTGKSFGNGTDEDFCTVKYNSAGQEVWVERYNGPGNGADRAYGIGVSYPNEVYVAGESWGGATGFDVATVKYGPGPAVEERSQETEGTGQAPIVTVVRAVLNMGQRLTADGSRLGIGLYDAAGRKVMALVPGPNDVRGLAPGVYFVRRASGVERQASGVNKVVVTR